MRVRFLKQLAVLALINAGPFFMPAAPASAQEDVVDEDDGDNERQDVRDDRQDARQEGRHERRDARDEGADARQDARENARTGRQGARGRR